MEKINEFFEYMRSLNEDQVIDIIVAVVIFALFITFGSIISYGILRIFYKKKTETKLEIQNFIKI